MVNLPAEDAMTELLSDEASVSDVESSGLDLATVDNGLNVSVIWSLSGEVLATVLVSGRSSVWDLKCLIEKCIIPWRIVATRITVMLGLQVLADADTLDDAGIVEGTTLSITAGSPYKILLCREGTAEMWNDGGRFERTFLGHTSEITTVEFSPDDTFVITCSSDCTAKLWQADVVECILTFRGHTAPVTSAVFNITGTEVLTASMDGTAKLWSVSSGICVYTLHHDHRPTHVNTALSPGGIMALTISGYSITVWNLQTGMRVWDVPGSREFCPRRANFSPRGDSLYICASPRNAIHLWTTVSMHPKYRRLAGHTGEVRCVAFSSDSLHMATGSSDKTARVWSLEHDWRVYTFLHEAVVDSTAISQGGSQVVTVSQRKAWLWNIDVQTPMRCFPHVWLALFTPDGRGVLTNGRRGTAVWSAGCGGFCWRLRTKFAGPVAFSHHTQQACPVASI